MFGYSDLQLELQRIQKALTQLSMVLSQSEFDSMCGELIAHRNRIHSRLKAAGWPTGLDTASLANRPAPTWSAKKIFEAWSHFVNTGEVSEVVNPMIAASWKRCYARVNPIQTIHPVRLNQAHLLSSQVASFELISIARPIMEDVYQYIENTGVVLLLVNSAGCLMDRIGNGEVISWLDMWGVTPGSILTEELMGTNAVGLALAERTSVEVSGPEHYLHALHQIAGTAAPMFDLSGRLLGVLGVFMIVDQYHKNYLAMISAAARAIEGQHQSDVLLAEHNSQLAQLNSILSSISDGILVWNAERILQHANPAAGDILNIDVKSMVGRSVGSLFTFPPFLYEAIDQRKPLSDVEVSIGYGDNTLTCMVNMDYVLNKNELQWIIVTLHTEKQIRESGSIQQSGATIPMMLEDIAGESPQIQQVRNFARSAARTRASVLIRGETGTGKNTLANTIHNISPRREGPFVIMACSSIPHGLLMRELLGQDESADNRRQVVRPSKFEQARGGTLFLQDVDTLPLDVQAALMNAVDSSTIQPIGSHRTIEIDARVIASTQVDIEKLVAQGNFRADLYYWLSTLMVTLPPLRERRKDILPVAERILRRVSQQWGLPKITFEPGVIEVFKTYSWPGNIRELEAVLGRATAQLGSGTNITLGMLPPSVRFASHQAPVIENPAPQAQSLMDIERQTILRTAQLCRGNVTLMARTLDISRTTLWRRMRQFGIYPKDYREGRSF
jgi:transcriptional activator for dhaKLM operon